VARALRVAKTPARDPGSGFLLPPSVEDLIAHSYARPSTLYSIEHDTTVETCSAGVIMAEIHDQFDTILILDFGSQVHALPMRRVAEPR
jgi:hypothetical protein